jgi:class 3 adenylate cyclase
VRRYGWRMATSEETAVRVVLFDDMRGSTALKELIAERSDEEAFQELRKEHDRLLASIVEREGAGEVIKSTGDGIIAVFERPSLAVERAIEIQERLHEHQYIRARIGIDVGEVKLERRDGRLVDVFGRHVDWAARATALAADGHVCVTRPVYTDGVSWITKKRIAWKEHGTYRLKRGDPALELFEPYNANFTRPMRSLRGDKVLTARGARPVQAVRAAAVRAAKAPTASSVVSPWESVARDGREFAQRGAGAMYWFRVPLGGVSYPEGFRSFLQPALENPRISKIRFVLDGTVAPVRRVWDDLVLPLVEEWGRDAGRALGIEAMEGRGRVVVDAGSNKVLQWIFVDLSHEFSPCFKLLVHDIDSDEETDSEAQVFLSTAARTVWLRDGTYQAIRIPDAVLRIRPGENDALLHALNAVANQWDSLFL